MLPVLLDLKDPLVILVALPARKVPLVLLVPLVLPELMVLPVLPDLLVLPVFPVLPVLLRSTSRHNRPRMLALQESVRRCRVAPVSRPRPWCLSPCARRALRRRGVDLRDWARRQTQGLARHSVRILA